MSQVCRSMASCHLIPTVLDSNTITVDALLRESVVVAPPEEEYRRILPVIIVLRVCVWLCIPLVLCSGIHALYVSIFLMVRVVTH